MIDWQEFNLEDVPMEFRLAGLQTKRGDFYTAAATYYATAQGLDVQAATTNDEEEERLVRIEDLRNSANNTLAAARRIDEIIKGITDNGD